MPTAGCRGAIGRGRPPGRPGRCIERATSGAFPRRPNGRFCGEPRLGGPGRNTGDRSRFRPGGGDPVRLPACQRARRHGGGVPGRRKPMAARPGPAAVRMVRTAPGSSRTATTVANTVRCSGCFSTPIRHGARARMALRRQPGQSGRLLQRHQFGRSRGGGHADRHRDHGVGWLRYFLMIAPAAPVALRSPTRSSRSRHCAMPVEAAW